MSEVLRDGGKGTVTPPPNLSSSSVSYLRKWLWQEGRGDAQRQAGEERQ